MKYCPNCKQNLPLTAFHINHARKNSYQSWCKSCKNYANRCARFAKGKAPERTRIMPQWGGTRYNAKLTPEDVILIRGLFEWLTCSEIARKFEVHRSTISAIKHGYSWYRLK